MDALLKIRSLVFLETIAYPDFEIATGEIVFLTGASGSGKSSLLRLLNATISPSAGHIVFDGEDVENVDTLALRRRVILAGQNPYLFSADIRENFRLFRRRRGLETLPDHEICAYLQLCGIDFPLEKPCPEFSGGEKQRVFLALALSFKPELILLDEPTSALDESTAERLLERLIAHFRAVGMSALIVTHNQNLVARLGLRVLQLGAKR